MKTLERRGSTVNQPTLPPHIQTIQDEVEKLAHSSIRWELDPNLDGAMLSNIENSVLVIRYRDFTDAGAAEELMHFKLIFSGFPRLLCPQNCPFVSRATKILENTLHHHIIFPELYKLGYDPKRSECEGIARQLKILSSADYSRLEKDPGLQAMFAMVYARAKLHCDDSNLVANVDTIFQAGLLKNAHNAGEIVVTTIRGQSNFEAQALRTTLLSCLSALGIADHVRVCI